MNLNQGEWLASALTMDTQILRIGLILMWVLAFLPLVGLGEEIQFKEAEEMDVSPRMFPNPKDAANYGSEELRKIGLLPDGTHEMYVKSLGFSSAAETLALELGVGLRTYDVALSLLKNFQRDDDPVALLIDIHEIIFPLLVENPLSREKQAKSSLTISELQPGKGWTVMKKGRSTLIRLIEWYRTSEVDNLVQISQLGLRFLGKRDKTYENELVLIPLRDRSEFGIQAGQPVLARDLFFELSRKATIPNPYKSGQTRQPLIGR